MSLLKRFIAMRAFKLAFMLLQPVSLEATRVFEGLDATVTLMHCARGVLVIHVLSKSPFVVELFLTVVTLQRGFCMSCFHVILQQTLANSFKTSATFDGLEIMNL